MSKDNAYLEDILEAAKAIRRFTDGVAGSVQAERGKIRSREPEV